MDFKKVLKKVNRLVFPTPKIGGLEITDSVINFYDLSNGGTPVVSLRLPPGIMEDGKVRHGEEANFTEALRTIHSQITADSKKIINVIFKIIGSSSEKRLFLKQTDRSINNE